MSTAVEETKKELRYDLSAVNGSLKVQITTEEQPRGRAVFSARMTDNVKETVSDVRIKLDAISLWVNKNTNDLIRGYFVFPRSGKLAIVFRELFKRDKVIRYSHEAAFTCDDDAKVIRYGSEAGFYKVRDTEVYGENICYPSKADAIHGIINESRSGVTIGGLDSVNLNVISDETFSELGFTEVVDELKRSPSMWMANPAVVVGSAGGSYRNTVDSNIKSVIAIIKKAVEHGS